jgi:hypothetical protein
MATTTTDNYRLPAEYVEEDRRVGWLKESVKEGEAWLKSQTAYSDLQRAKDIIAGVSEDKLPSSLSRVRTNLQKRLLREIVATVANVRPLWGYKTFNKDLAEQELSLNKILSAWYHMTFADRDIRRLAQLGGGLGTGYIGPTWQSDFWNVGLGDVKLKTYAPDDVLPIQLPADGDLQRAYIVHIREAVPINLARAMFPALAHKITPDREAPKGIGQLASRAKSFVSPVLNRFASGQKAKQSLQSVFPEVDVYHSYVMDLSINPMGSKPRVMGEPGTSWSYVVPALGDDIPDGRGGTRKATHEDAMLYPLRRLVIWCNAGVLRDGPSYWWHGKVPAIKFCFDDWAWETLGYSMFRDTHALETSNNSIRRAIDDSANARLKPTLQYDDQTVSQSLMERIDPRQGGQSVGVDMTRSEMPIRPLIPPEYYNLPQWIFQTVKDNEEMQKYLVGASDFTAIAKARQLPSAETVDKLMEMAGPLVTDVSRNLERTLGQLGELVKCMFFQFYTTPRVLQILGPDGVSESTYDFVPGSLIPSHMPHEKEIGPEGKLIAPNKPSVYDQIRRAKHYMNSFVFHVTPNSLVQITQMSRKLLMIQLSKAGVPIDPWTMAEINDIPNYGPPPDGAKNVFDRWVAFQRLQGELQATVQAKAQEILMANQIKMQMAQGAMAMLSQGVAGPLQAAAGGGEAPAPEIGPKNPQGRPPSGDKPPHIEQKDGGTRSTISQT